MNASMNAMAIGFLAQMLQAGLYLLQGRAEVLALEFYQQDSAPSR
ncbi:MAG TPA: hypothetical protein VL334_14830 [Anaerolineae bacterium]|nr:hypothetical protein [Anaerolineae bacterium]